MTTCPVCAERMTDLDFAIHTARHTNDEFRVAMGMGPAHPEKRVTDAEPELPAEPKRRRRRRSGAVRAAAHGARHLARSA